ncbi:MAG TPA: sugar phosphate isomerase/epimerase [Candidatus Andersenbacteria bacterium]|nr:sugar phosphate isomerase/epimerase [Candidatus Andersenbacteria bacterium]
MRLLLSSGLAFKCLSLHETEALALDIGYDGLELMMPPRGMTSGETDRDTDFASVSRAPLVHAGGDLFDVPRYTQSLSEAVAAARQAGATMINVHPPAAQFGGRAHVVWGIEYLQQQQQAHGIDFLYEVLVDPGGVAVERQAWFAARQAYFTLDDWVRDVETYDLRATLDTCHVGTWGVEVAQYVERLGDRLAHVHFSDYNRTTRREHLVPGEGDVDLTGFLRALAARRPEITLTVELNPVETPAAVREAAECSREYIAQALAGEL